MAAAFLLCPRVALPLRRGCRLVVSCSASSSDAPGGVEFQGRVGFLGLGIMGAPMASNLIKAGCDVTVWNRTKSKCDPLLSLGAKFEASPARVASSCDVTFAMLADPESAAEVACGTNGAAEGMAPGKGYVDVSTVDDVTSKLIGERITSTGASFLEVNFCHHAWYLRKCTSEIHFCLVPETIDMITQGDESLYKRVTPLLDVMGKSRFFLGDVGNGAAMKLVVNMIMGSMMVSFAEGLLLSEKVGLDRNTVIEAISQGAINAPMFSLKGPSMVKASYPTAFPLKHQQKDLRLALALAESVSQPIPTAAAANELYKAAKSLGLANQDFSAVIEALKAKVQSSQQ
ncbi:glyoxylate/succinic semialdehyde reductase 2, chloroplastic isoform X1 [Brachypodium distachyon]|uniref:glyoxylate/succinic semialdehyde reductase 2, chloroplastic isoform X1 n=1 Tax=Brachypodium distachyon TaxID=15368 RepID=UPI00071D919C|nr:glyoxylate/succinic semialdehyde reductase 2, chloroplastic isoform X1 [Brachypodium distachyon]|eukprot:XP_014753482.1 glyoxylate/succinic semialdehyde reductase 2, chloroplastic isoform X1 [Brachypodium distachyon]